MIYHENIVCVCMSMLREIEELDMGGQDDNVMRRTDSIPPLDAGHVTVASCASIP